MAEQTKARPMFAIEPEGPADLLINAAAVIHFLSDITESLVGDAKGSYGLSESGAFGLYHILNAVENTLDEARKRMEKD